MKPMLSLALFCGTFTLASAGTPFANSGFESESLAPWRLAAVNCTATAAADASSPCEGGKALRLSVTEFKAPYCAVLNTAAIPGSELQGKAVSIAYRGEKPASLLLRYRLTVNGKKDYRYDILHLEPSAGWRHFSWPLNPPEGTDEVCLELRANAAGDYFFDDLQFVPAAEAKIIANGGFEEDLDGTWRLVNHSKTGREAVLVSLDGKNPASGTKSLKMELREDIAPFAAVMQKIRIASADAFRGKALSFAFRGGRPTIVIADFKSIKAGKTEHTYTFCKLPADMGWKRFSFPLNVPEKAVEVTVELRANLKGSYWFDEVAFRPVQK